MKKKLNNKLLLILVVFIIVIAFLLNFFINKENNKQQSSKDNSSKNSIKAQIQKKETIYDRKITDGFMYQGDILLFDKMISNDIEFFNTNKKEIEFFHIWRNYLYGDNYGNNELTDLTSCLDGKKTYLSLTGVNRDICKGENKYLAKDDNNFFHIKDTLINFKKIKESKNFSCNYFLSDIYDFPVDKKYKYKINDYILCNKFLKLDNYDIKKELFYFNLALYEKKCNQLKDKNLIKLCEYGNKMNISKSKK